ncbi:MFS transporter [Mycobacterium genavense]|uniref:MFS transporter n=1 Tax=Mycobacterium genavense TaxID=36812 RepID=UPI00316ABFAF
MLSLANSSGRLLWSAASDAVGRKNMYRLYLGLGAMLYAVLIIAQNASKPLFLVVCILLLSFYGAGFATVPAYLRDLFGYLEVGAIHGRLLTAWSTAGVLGPVIVNAIADNRIAAHVVGPERYRWSFMIMVILLLIGVVCNELIRTPPPRAARLHCLDGGYAKARVRDFWRSCTMSDQTVTATSPRVKLLGLVSRLWVGVPFTYGLYEVVAKIPALFTN